MRYLPTRRKVNGALTREEGSMKNSKCAAPPIAHRTISQFLRALLLIPVILIPVIFASFANAADYFAVDNFEIDSDPKYDSLEIVSFNVGNMGGSATNLLLGRTCTNFKLCKKASVDTLKNWAAKIHPDVFLFQETMGIKQLLGNEFGGPVLDSQVYDGFCNYHACVAWKKSKLKIPQSKEKNCRLQTDEYGDLVLCELDNQGMIVQFISAYFPAVARYNPPFKIRAHRRAELSDYLFNDSKNFVSGKKPVLVGGDFNTTLCTFNADCHLPYPENYYTLVGANVKGYGQMHERLEGRSPDESFFGAYQNDRPQVFYTHFYYGLKHQIDHMFANFGFPLQKPTSSVSPFSGSTCDAGLACPNLVGADFDHRPIFGRIGFLRVENPPPTTPDDLRRQVREENSKLPARRP